MLLLGYEPRAFDLHLPQGLWPVYVVGGIAFVCLVTCAAMVLVMRGGSVGADAPRLGGRARMFGAAGMLLAAIAAGLYVYADARYQDCLADGHYGWQAPLGGRALEEGAVICDRAVLGEVAHEQ